MTNRTTVKSHVVGRLAQHWWTARGGFGPAFMRPSRQFPNRCELCNRLENPITDERFIAVFGEVMQKVYRPYESEADEVVLFGLVWYCRQLLLECPTDQAHPHIRFICYQHGTHIRSTVVDCQTAVTHQLSPQPPSVALWWLNWTHEVWYWLHVVTRFVWFVADEIVQAACHPRLYWQWINMPLYAKNVIGIGRLEDDRDSSS